MCGVYVKKRVRVVCQAHSLKCVCMSSLSVELRGGVTKLGECSGRVDYNICLYKNIENQHALILNKLVQ